MSVTPVTYAPPFCALCDCEGGAVHNHTPEHMERVRQAFDTSKKAKAERYGSVHRCGCCDVPTPERGMCDGCEAIHGKKLAPKVEGLTTCPRALLQSEGIAEHWREVRDQAEVLGRKLGPSREALEAAAYWTPDAGVHGGRGY